MTMPMHHLIFALALGAVMLTGLSAHAEPGSPGNPPSASGSEVLAVTDADESYDLPAYPPGARIATGQMQTYTVQEEDTFLDIARHFGLGYIELRAANPGVDPWAPTPGDEIVIPSFNLLPRASQEGIVVNLGDMRLYYFKEKGQEPISYALGIGREGLGTPTGTTTVVRKAANPSWFPTPRMREENPALPASVPPGASNPLGTHAIYLGWPTFLIHGSNKPWGIGRRVSSGCMRMYPEDIVALFPTVPNGTKVTIVDQPILLGWLEDGLYLEANPSKTQGNDIEITGEHVVRPLTDELKNVILAAAGDEAANRIDWDTVDRTVRERRGYPVLIAKAQAPRAIKRPPPVVAEPETKKPAVKQSDKKNDKKSDKKSDTGIKADDKKNATLPTRYN